MPEAETQSGSNAISVSQPSSSAVVFTTSETGNIED